MKKILCITLFVIYGIVIRSQDDIVKPINTPLFGDSKVEDIRVISSESENLLIEVRFGDLEDKDYVVKANLLNKYKKVLKSFSCEAQTVSSGSGTVDLQFQPNNKIKSNSPTAKSNFIKIKLAEKDDDSIFSDLEDLVGGGSDNPLDDMFSESFLFKYEKDWRVKGSKSMMVKVSFKPIGSAKTLN